MSAELKAFPIPPVVKRATVALPVEAAFRRFTEEIGSWWPMATHSLSTSAAATIRFENHVGGRLIEGAPDGSEHVWGSVTRWGPPGDLAFTWHVGRAPETAQLIELCFEEAEPGQTLVTLTHSGWETLGDAALERRNGYESGWDAVFVKAFADLGG